MEWYEILVSILAGVATAIPLVIKLVEYVQKAVREKNYGLVVQLVMNLMAEAEEKFDNGADRKEWVLSMVQASADTVDYPINIEQIGLLIDALCSLTKKINTD